MSTHNIPFSMYKRKSALSFLNLQLLDLVNEPSVLFYCILCSALWPFHIAKDRNFIPMTPIEDLTQVVISYVIYEKSLWQVS